MLPEREAASVADELAVRFAGLTAATRFMWEHFAAAESIRDSDGWRWIGDLAPPGPVLLVFEDLGRWHGLELPSGAVVGDLLGDCPGFEPFLTDPACSYVICHNHHDVVIAAGVASAAMLRRGSAQAP